MYSRILPPTSMLARPLTRVVAFPHPALGAAALGLPAPPTLLALPPLLAPPDELLRPPFVALPPVLGVPPAE